MRPATRSSLPHPTASFLPHLSVVSPSCLLSYGAVSLYFQIRSSYARPLSLGQVAAQPTTFTVSPARLPHRPRLHWPIAAPHPTDCAQLLPVGRILPCRSTALHVRAPPSPTTARPSPLHQLPSPPIHPPAPLLHLRNIATTARFLSPVAPPGSGVAPAPPPLATSTVTPVAASLSAASSRRRYSPVPLSPLLLPTVLSYRVSRPCSVATFPVPAPTSPLLVVSPLPDSPHAPSTPPSPYPSFPRLSAIFAAIPLAPSSLLLASLPISHARVPTPPRPNPTGVDRSVSSSFSPGCYAPAPTSVVAPHLAQLSLHRFPGHPSLAAVAASAPSLGYHG